MELVEKLTLVVNPMLSRRHVQFYHACSERQAGRFMDYWRAVTGKCKPTFLDFYLVEGCFPDPLFNPHWVSIRVPISNAAIMGHIGTN